MMRETVTTGLHGSYQDVLRDPRGRVVWERGRRDNVIVDDCRRLLAGFLRGGTTTALGLQGLWVGEGNVVWDTAGTPPPAANQTALVDSGLFLLPRAQLQVDYLTGATPSASPTNRLQIFAKFGPGVPGWPSPAHPSNTLREFGLVGMLDGTLVLLNYVTHPAIVKDSSSTLERTIWLDF